MTRLGWITGAVVACELVIAHAAIDISDHVAQGRLCRRIHQTALIAARAMFTEWEKVLINPPALFGYYAAMIALESGDVEAAHKGFSALAQASDAPERVRQMARIWHAVCESMIKKDSQPLLDLPKPNPKTAPRLAAEAGRARAFLGVDLVGAQTLCSEAVRVAYNPADLQAIHLSHAIVLLARQQGQEALSALNSVNPQRPIDECEIEKVKLPKRELMRTLRFFDPALLSAWAEYHFFTATNAGEHVADPRLRHQVAAGFMYLGHLQKAEELLHTTLNSATENQRDRLSALALLGQVAWTKGDKNAAHMRWQELAQVGTEEAVTQLLQVYGDIPALTAEIIEKGINSAHEMLKNLRQQEAEYSERRFRERHLDLFWALGRGCYATAAARISAGDLIGGARFLAEAEELGNLLYDEASRYDLERHSPLFLAELGEVYLLNVLGLGRSNAYLEDMLRYMYDERMLPKLVPAAWQVREFLQTLFALRDLTGTRETAAIRVALPTPPSPYKELVAVKIEPSQKELPTSTAFLWWGVLVGAVALTACALVFVLWRQRTSSILFIFYILFVLYSPHALFAQANDVRTREAERERLQKMLESIQKKSASVLQAPAPSAPSYSEAVLAKTVYEFCVPLPSDLETIVVDGQKLHIENPRALVQPGFVRPALFLPRGTHVLRFYKEAAAGSVAPTPLIITKDRFFSEQYQAIKQAFAGAGGAASFEKLKPNLWEAKENYQSPLTPHLLGNYYFYKKRYALAERKYWQAIRVNPCFALAHLNLACIYARHAGELGQRPGVNFKMLAARELHWAEIFNVGDVFGINQAIAALRAETRLAPLDVPPAFSLQDYLSTETMDAVDRRVVGVLDAAMKYLPTNIERAKLINNKAVYFKYKHKHDLALEAYKEALRVLGQAVTEPAARQVALRVLDNASALCKACWQAGQEEFEIYKEHMQRP